jgi:hypothetical protein
MFKRNYLPVLITLVLILCCLSLFAQRRGSRRSNAVQEVKLPFINKIPPGIIQGCFPVQVERSTKEKIVINESLEYFSDSTYIEDVAVEVEFKNPEEGKKLAALKSATASSPLTKKINKADITEAYPFLSADGLRLYFTSNQEGGHGRLYISTRNSPDQEFGAPQVLSKHLTDPFYCGTLTADELTIYLANNGTIYVSQRKDRNSSFGPPEKLEEISNGWAFGPGISPDGKELVITTTPEGYNDEVNVLYRKDAGGKFRQVEVLASPEGMDAGPAQFSKDGLSLYCSLENKKNSEEKLYRYKRNSLQARFIQMEELPAVLNIHNQCLQPTVNGDESLMAYVVSNGGWSEDDIVLVNMQGSKVHPSELTGNNQDQNHKMLQQINPAQVKVYPNPFRDHVVFEMKENPLEGTVFELYDLSGKLLKKERITDRVSDIKLTEGNTGFYLFRIMSRDGKILSSGKLVRE